MSDTLRVIQSQLKPWVEHNFGRDPDDPRPDKPLRGAFEEAGELAEVEPNAEVSRALLYFLGRISHADLKAEQGIRGNEDHEATAKDAMADLIIYLLDYSNARGWDAANIVWETWQIVAHRDWSVRPATG